MKRFFATGLLMIATLFVNGQVKDSTMQKGCGVVIAEETLDTIYEFAEVMPVFPGDEMLEYLAKNIHLSSGDESCAVATVYVSFVVLKNGQLANIRLAKELQRCPETGQDVLNAFCKMPNWEPGEINSMPVNVRMRIPIRLN